MGFSKTQGPWLLGFVFLLAFTSQHAVYAAKTVFRCEKDGQITLTDKPCDDSKAAESKSATTIASSSSPSPIGTWNGQVQYAGKEAGEDLAEAHTVVLLALAFTADGKVSGASFGNGCYWLGIWSQGGKGLERLISLDLSLSKCGYSGFNRRYTGTFLLAVPDASGQINLLAYTPPVPGTKVRGYTLGGTLRR